MVFNFKTDLIDVLYSYGVYDVVIPFLLVFTIIFAFLQKTMILGKKNGKPITKYNVIISLVMGILVLRIPLISQIFQNALPKVGVTIIAILMFFILIGMFTNSETGMPKAGFLRTVILVLPALAVGYYFLSEVYDYFPYAYFITDNIQTIIVIAIFAVIIFAITSGDDKKEYDYAGTKFTKKAEFNKKMWEDFISNKNK
ncbi:MAG: hypothetical protein WC755_01770 [Candidatus Woesearchaeota archaeon]|jgi:hypothetical protein